MKTKKTVFVTVELFQGIVNQVRVFRSEKLADKAEKKWLAEQGIKDEISRECKAQNGIEFYKFECEIEQYCVKRYSEGVITK